MTAVAGVARAGAGLVAGGLAGVVLVWGIPEADLGSAVGGVWAKIAPLALRTVAKVRIIRERCIGS